MYLLTTFKKDDNENLKLAGLGVIGSVAGHGLARTSAVSKLLKTDSKSNQQKLKLEYKNNSSRIYRQTMLDIAKEEASNIKKIAIQEAAEYKNIIKNNKGNKDVVSRAIQGIKRIQKISKEDSTNFLNYAKRNNQLKQKLKISSVKSYKKNILLQNKKLTNRVGIGLSIIGSLAVPAIYKAIKNRKTRTDKGKLRGKYK